MKRPLGTSEWPFSWNAERGTIESTPMPCAAMFVSFQRSAPRWAVGGVVLCCSQMVGAQASSEQTTSLLGPEFAVILGPSGQLGCLPRTESKAALSELVQNRSAELSIDPQLVVVLSLDVPICGDLFYAAVANDVRGIGYGHFFEGELFDESPQSALEGVAFLNDTTYWETRPDELTRAFVHELGHRWSARVHVGGESATSLLGRDGEHWSYFLDTSTGTAGLSPLEGNAWHEEPPNLYVSDSRERQPTYSQLDLYLMGLVPPSEVAPLILLSPNDPPNGQDCQGGTVRSASPPQTCEVMSLDATAESISIDDIIAAEGAREPAYEDPSPVVTTVGFFVLAPDGSAMSEATCGEWSARVQLLVSEFARATGGRMVLQNVTQGPALCDQIAAATTPSAPRDPSPSRGCSLDAQRGLDRQHGSSTSTFWWLAALVFCVGTARVRVRKARRCSAPRSPRGQ